MNEIELLEAIVNYPNAYHSFTGVDIDNTEIRKYLKDCGEKAIAHFKKFNYPCKQSVRCGNTMVVVAIDNVEGNYELSVLVCKNYHHTELPVSGFSSEPIDKKNFIRTVKEVQGKDLQYGDEVFTNDGFKKWSNPFMDEFKKENPDRHYLVKLY